MHLPAAARQNVGHATVGRAHDLRRWWCTFEQREQMRRRAAGEQCTATAREHSGEVACFDARRLVTYAVHASMTRYQVAALATRPDRVRTETGAEELLTRDDPVRTARQHGDDLVDRPELRGHMPVKSGQPETSPPRRLRPAA